MSDVYVVRLTEEEREIILDTPPARGPNSPLWPIYSRLTAKLESARPEHPERQGLLEELAALALLVSYTANDPNDEGQRRFREAAKRFRSLEAK